MGYRKVIKFGESSHVVSLPKEWLDKNTIKKGDLLHIEDEGPSLRINAPLNKVKTKLTETTIDFEDEYSFKHALSSAYVNNYNLITVVGDHIQRDANVIREIATKFIALEIIQQTSKKIVLKDFLNVRDIKIDDVFRRMDRIILSMCEDTKEIIEGNKELLQNVKQKEEDINKFFGLMFKTLNKCEKPTIMRQFNLTQSKTFLLLQMTIFLEKFADEVKRVAKCAVRGSVKHKEIIPCFQEMVEQYKESMKAYYTGNKKLAMNVRFKRNDMFKKCDLVFAGFENPVLIEKMKNMSYHSANIASALIKSDYA